MSTEKTLLAAVGSLLTAVGSLVRETDGPRILLAKLGWDLPPGVDDIGLAGLDLARVGDRLTAWINLAADLNSSTDEEALALGELALAVLETLDDLSDLRLEAPQEYLDRTGIKDEFLTRLLDLYLIQSTAIASRPAFDIAILLGWFELRPHEADPAIFQVAHLRHVVHWDRVPMILSDPTGLLRETYGWGTTTFDADSLVTRLGGVLQHFAAEVSFRELPPIPLARLLGGTPPIHKPQIQLFLTLLGSSGLVISEGGLSVFGLPPTIPNGMDGGLGLAPYAQGATNLRIPLTSTLSIGMSAQADLGSGLALVLRPGNDPSLRTGLNEPQAGTASPGAEMQLDLTQAVPQGEPAMTLITAAGAKIEATSIALAVGVLVDSGGTDATLSLQFNGGRLTITTEDLPFLGEVLPAEGLTADFDVNLSWSHRNGVQLDGRAELTTIKLIGRQLGPVTINILEIGLATSEGGFAFTTAVGATITLGPVHLTIERIGVRSAITPGPGSLGSADLNFRFLPPNGLGLSIDGGGFTGGGFLRYVEADERYEGMLELEYQDRIALKAIGLLTTRMPDGSEGFSLLIIITAEFSPPFELGLGFKLSAVGGLLGLNRTANVERLRTGLRDNTLNSVLFPQNVIANASRILSDLTQVFPPQADRFLFGPMARITWGTPALLTIDLGLLIEIPDPVRVLILGVVRALLPDEEKRLLQLQVNFLGVIDFEAQRFAFDASLFDSKLLSYTLSGDMAVRLNWGAEPNFLLTVGGFHPAYEPPPLNLPSLRRLTLQLLGDNPRLTLETYFAVTSNTVQFGAKVELLAKAGSFSVYGFLSFDVLFQFNPFYFIAAISAKLALRAGSSEIASISLDFTLEGPTPWHAKGTAKLKICWFLTIKVRFDKTFGEERNTRLDDILVLPLLQAALSDPGNWEGHLPDNRHLLVSFKQIQTIGELVVYPFGILIIQQKVVPLQIEIQKFGSQRPADGNRFAIEQVLAGEGGDTEALTTHAVGELFAPAQFFEMSDAQKLSSQSFERYDSGVKLVDSEAFEGDYAVRRVVAYELFYIDEQRALLQQPEPHVPDLVAFEGWALSGAIANSPLSHARNGTSALAPEAVQVGQEAYAVVNASDLRPVVAGAQAASEAGAYRLMEGLIRGNPALEGDILVVPVFEVNRS